jgi:hypothetical protein
MTALPTRLALGLVALGLTSFHAAQAQAPAAKPGVAKPSLKAPAPKPPPVQKLPVAEGEQLAAAAMAHYGDYDCEFKQTVHVGLNDKNDGYVEVKSGKQSWMMKPIASSTGAIRLEDLKGQYLVIQIANKSMLFPCLQAYRQHAAERAALGIPPLPLDAKQTAELIELIKARPPAKRCLPGRPADAPRAARRRRRRQGQGQLPGRRGARRPDGRAGLQGQGHRAAGHDGRRLQRHPLIELLDDAAAPSPPRR